VEVSLATETEVKLNVPSMDEFRHKLASMKPKLLSERHFEDNFVLDYPDGRLRSRACLMRVRKTKQGESVTFKGPPQPSLHFKKREELETQVDNADQMLAILEQLGLRIWFRYQKYREEHSVTLAPDAGGEVKVALDWTPIGDYVELEGSEEGIRQVAARLGFRECQFLRDSYYALFLQSGIQTGNMIFSDRT
jgi:adenylate cyclase, class 2